ncbi:hypothetical protein J6590_074234 [Homalodisca vitripennis]|nr:hypothetical protein J6590_074234 [Homalodisca vitripennis]
MCVCNACVHSGVRAEWEQSGASELRTAPPRRARTSDTVRSDLPTRRRIGSTDNLISSRRLYCFWALNGRRAGIVHRACNEIRRLLSLYTMRVDYKGKWAQAANVHLMCFMCESRACSVSASLNCLLVVTRSECGGGVDVHRGSNLETVSLIVDITAVQEEFIMEVRDRGGEEVRRPDHQNRNWEETIRLGTDEMMEVTQLSQ